MSSLIPSGSSSGTGSMTLLAPVTNSNQTVTIPDVTGTVMVSGNMPAFSAYKSTNQSSISNSIYTKVTFDTEIFDTNNNFASSAFTPTVAGYYQVNASIDAGSGLTYGYTTIAKNGSYISFGSGSSSSMTELFSASSVVVYCNGTTDYIEVFIFMVSSTTSTTNIVYSGSRFNAAMVRSA
jgi:hypothetical protein